MANPKGIITRKDIIEDEALKWGEVYSENIKEAVKQNNILVASVKELNKQVQSFKVANSQKDYITAKQAEALATQEAINAIKLQEAAELSADKIRRSNIATLKAETKAKEGNVKLTIEEKVQNEINNRVLKQEALERLGLVSAYTKLNKARTDAKNTLRDLIASESASTAEIKKAQKEFEILDKKVRKADAAVGDFTKNVGNYPFKNITSGIKNLIGAFGVTGGIVAFAGILKSAFDEVKKFEQGVADLSAITGASGKDLEFLSKQAIELGKETKGGAVKVVEAYKLIASAKPELLSNVKALNQVTQATLTLAKASGLDLPEAATALTDALNQFGAPAEEAGKFLDALANGSKFGSAEIPQVTEALLKFGAVARSSNVDIHESTALIELLAENGIKGAEAGTALRNVLLKISAPDTLPKEAQKALKDLGISFELLKDKSIPIQQKFEALKPLLSDNGKLLKTFGFENTIAAQNIIEHTDRLEELTGKMSEFGGAEKQAEIRSQTLQGETDKLVSTYDSLILSLNEGSGVVSKFFSFFIVGSKNALDGIIRLNTSFEDLFKQAELKGSENGVKLYQERLNALLGKKLTDEQRKKVKERIKEIQDEISKGANDPKLIDEKNNLFKQLGTSDEKSVSISIAKAAKRRADLLVQDIDDINKKIIEKEKSLKKGFSIKDLFEETPADLKRRKEDLLRSLAEENAIIQENNKKQKGIKTSPLNPVNDNNPDGEKGNKAELQRLKILYEARKKYADDEFKLNQFRLQTAAEINKEISDDEKQNIEDRTSALFQSFQFLEAKNREAAEFELKQLGDFNDQKGVFIRELTDFQISEIIRTGKTSEKLSSEQLLIYEQYKKNEVEITKKAEEQKQAIIDSEVGKKIQKKIDAELLLQETKLNKAIEAENNRFNALNDIETQNQSQRETAIEEHERRIFEIKKKFALDALNLQVSTIQKELDENAKRPIDEQISADKRKQIEADLQRYKTEISSLSVNQYKEDSDKKADIENVFSEKVKEISSGLNSALSELSNAIFSGRIQNLDAEIQKNDEFYNRQIEAAGKDARLKDLLQKEQEKKRKALEEQKRKEQTKQAIFNKAMAITQAGINLGVAVTAALATTPPASFALAAFTAALAGIQLAAVIAAPIPKYKGGRKGGKAETAWVGDGYVSEVHEKADGRAFITPAKPTLTYLEKGDNVYSSVDEYLRLQRSSSMTSINLQGKRATAYQAEREFNNHYSKEIVEELKRNTKAIEKNKPIIQNNTKFDFGHEFWKHKNTNWN